MSANSERWYFSKADLDNSPSRRCGLDADKELSQRQQAANFIQDMGQRLQVTQLCINTAIVYMHRFYVFHSFTHFHRNAIATASLFLAAKVEEQPRKLEHIIKVAQKCLQKGQSSSNQRSDSEQAQELVVNENLLLQTLGFDVAIEHPHTYIVQCCHMFGFSKDLSQTSYFMATNSLHLTTMCLQYRPKVVACFCIHLICKWSDWNINSQNKPWFYYIDNSVTLELLEQITNEFLVIFEKCPSKLKNKLHNSQNSMQHSIPSFHCEDTRKGSLNGHPSTSGLSHNSRQNDNHDHSRNNERRSITPMMSSQPHLNKPFPGPSAPKMLPTTTSTHNYQKIPSSNNAPPHRGNVIQPVSHPHVQTSHQKTVMPHITQSVTNPKYNIPMSNHHLPHKDSQVKQETNVRSDMNKLNIVDPVKHESNVPKQMPKTPSVSSHIKNNLHRKDYVDGSRYIGASHSDIIQNVLKEVVEQNVKKEIKSNDSTPDENTVATLDLPSVSSFVTKTAPKPHSIFSPVKVIDQQPELIPEREIKSEPSSDVLKKQHRVDRISSSQEQELVPMVKKLETVAGYENIFTKQTIPLPASPKATTSTTTGEKIVAVESVEEQSEEHHAPSNHEHQSHKHDDYGSSSHHKKKKKHKEKDKRHDKEKKHKDKKRHKDDKHHKKEHRDKEAPREPGPIKITIPKEKLVDIPKLKIKITHNAPSPDDDSKFKINKDMIKSSRKRERESDHYEHSSKRMLFSQNGFNDH